MGRVGRVFRGLLVAALLVAALLGTSVLAVGRDRPTLESVLLQQEAWLATSVEGPGWNRFLMTDSLREQLSSGRLDRRLVAKILNRYESNTPGLEHPYFAATREALRRWADENKVSLAVRWSEQVRAAAKDPPPISDASIERARNEVQDASGALNQMLHTADSDTRDGWKKFLKWNDLEQQLETGSPDWKALEGVGAQFFNGHPGLEYPEFVRVRDSLRKYLYLGSLGSTVRGQSSIKLQLESLADALERYNSEPTTKNAAEVATLVDWLAQLERVPKLASEIREAHNLPNVRLRISEGLLARRFAQDVNEPMYVNEFILGTHVTGHANTTGKISADIVPDANVARVDIVFRGTTHTRSVGRQKPVTIQSTTLTALEARKPLYLSSTDITSGPASARGSTKTTIHSITPDKRFGRRLIQKVAWRRASSQTPQSEVIASNRAARRLERRIDEQSQELLTRAQQTLREQLQGPINRRGLIPERIRTFSQDTYATVLATQADKSQFAAITHPPSFCPQDDVVAQVHESAINNTAEKAIAGLTLTDERIAELTKEITGSVPEELQIKQEDQPWSISFDWQQPITVEFDNETLKIAVRGRRFTSGERVLNKVMEMSATYTLRTTPAGVNLTRQGDIEVRFPANTSERLRNLDRVFKILMEKKFSELFKPEIQGEGFSLPGRFDVLGKIRLNDLSADDGWLSLGWK